MFDFLKYLNEQDEESDHNEENEYQQIEENKTKKETLVELTQLFELKNDVLLKNVVNEEVIPETISIEEVPFKSVLKEEKILQPVSKEIVNVFHTNDLIQILLDDFSWNVQFPLSTEAKHIIHKLKSFALFKEIDDDINSIIADHKIDFHDIPKVMIIFHKISSIGMDKLLENEFITPAHSMELIRYLAISAFTHSSSALFLSPDKHDIVIAIINLSMDLLSIDPSFSVSIVRHFYRWLSRTMKQIIAWIDSWYNE